MAQSQPAGSGLAAPICVLIAALALSACSEGAPPRTVTVGEDSYPVHHLVSLTDPWTDLYIAPDHNVFIEFGRAEPVIACEAAGYHCQEWPFVFAFPLRGDAPEDGWSVGDYQFRIVEQVERRFCGRAREAYLIEGANPAGWATRVWYHPDFGVYAVMSGQSEDGEMVTVERAYTTCDRGLYARQGGGLDGLMDGWPF
ncbi:hypothetical protein L2D01_14510 [Hyphomonadaceae bacterium ML37]|nr:hypothetical protein L2D01_14510 [Hyphomonadaceae bacterium ML37]